MSPSNPQAIVLQTNSERKTSVFFLNKKNPSGPLLSKCFLIMNQIGYLFQLLLGGTIPTLKIFPRGVTFLGGMGSCYWKSDSSGRVKIGKDRFFGTLIYKRKGISLFDCFLCKKARVCGSQGLDSGWQ